MITVRPVREADLPILVQMEIDVWSSLETPILTSDELIAWYLEDSPYFLVAEHGERICGYYFGRRIAFTLDDVAGFLDPAHASGRGFSDYAHLPDGDTHYGINIVSTMPGAGRALYDAVWNLHRRYALTYAIAFTRLTGLRAYMDNIQNTSDEIALWYAHESARLLGLRTWDGIQIPAISLPALPEADRMLAFHTKGSGFGVVGVLPNYMPDPESKNYGCLVLSEYPHL